MTNITNFPINGKKTSELNNATIPLTGAEILAAVQGGANVKLTTQDIINILLDNSSKIQNTFLNTASESTAGIAEIANDTEVFNKNTDKILTAFALFNNIRLSSFSVGNFQNGIGQVIAPGASYNILTNLLESNESQSGEFAIIYKDINNMTRNTFLDQVNNKFVFPSNLYTFNNVYVPYFFRIIGTFDISSTSSQSTKFNIRLRRQIDNSIIFTSAPQPIADEPAQTGVAIGTLILSFVNGELDPFVLDGCYLDIINSASSATSITLQSINIRIFRGV